MILRLLLILVALLPIAADAKVKVMEKSDKHTPDWIGELDDDYIITTSTNQTLEGAQAHCLEYIRKAIVNSVAVNIVSTESLTQEEAGTGSDLQVKSEYKSEIESIAAKLPFINDIALQKGEGYWEKLYDKSTKSTSYIYHVKYPFSQFERDQLIAQFESQDREQYNKYLEIEREFERFDKVEYIAYALNELSSLKEYFFDELRDRKVETLIQNYRNSYGNIKIEVISEELERHHFKLMLNGREVTTAIRPRLKSETAVKLSIVPINEATNELTYSAEYAYDDVENRIDVSYGFPYKPLKYTFFFDKQSEKIEVYPLGIVRFSVVKSGESKYLRGTVNLRSKCDNPFCVTGLELNAKGINCVIKSDDKMIFKGETEHQYIFVMKSPFKTNEERGALTTGSLFVTDEDGGNKQVIRVALPYTL